MLWLLVGTVGCDCIGRFSGVVFWLLVLGCVSVAGFAFCCVLVFLACLGMLAWCLWLAVCLLCCFMLLIVLGMQFFVFRLVFALLTCL